MMIALRRALLALSLAIASLQGAHAQSTAYPVIFVPASGFEQLPANYELLLRPSASGQASLRIPHGSAPSSPVNGDIWTTTSGLFAFINGVTIGPYGTGGGSVTTLSVVTANGFAGTVATATTTPAITISTTVTGALKGNGTGLSQAACADLSNASAGCSSTNALISGIEFLIDGGGTAITTGQKGFLEVPFACTINRSTLLADQTGSIVVDIWKVAYGSFPPSSGNSITASDIPTLSSAQNSQDSTLTGWTTSVSAGDVLAFNVNSASTVTRVTLSLKCTKS